MCTAEWSIGERGVACVEVTGEIYRNMAATSPDNTYCDFSIDYVSHVVKIQIGQYSETDTSIVRFSEAVDFNQFFPQDNAIGLTSSLVLVLTGIFATFF